MAKKVSKLVEVVKVELNSAAEVAMSYLLILFIMSDSISELTTQAKIFINFKMIIEKVLLFLEMKSIANFNLLKEGRS